MLKHFLTVLLALASPLTAHADAVGRLKDFIANVRSAQATFTQEVRDNKGKRIQSASGTMHFSRPGRFRWTYQKPYEQIIVGDGVKFWMYDMDLNQVTVKKLDAALGSSPAALLSGSHEIERDFVLKDMVACEPSQRGGASQPQAASQPQTASKPEAASQPQAAPGPQPASRAAGGHAASCVPAEDGLEWLEARPKTAETSFESIRMAFNARADLVVMELHDTFGHVTVLRFSEMQRNPKFPAELFRFEPPKGADVLGDEK